MRVCSRMGKNMETSLGKSDSALMLDSTPPNRRVTANVGFWHF
jgi:hypothetical protein